MHKRILTNVQLKAKLINYGFEFSNNDFDRLKKLGFFHVFNSFVGKDIRVNGVKKKLVDYLNLYDLDRELRAILFPMIVHLEGAYKQRLNDVVVEELLANHSNDPTHNEVVKFCVRENANLEIKKLLFRSINIPHRIVDHYFLNHEDIPIWGYFELFTLDNFITFLENTTTDKHFESKGSTNRGIQEKLTLRCGYTYDNGEMLVIEAKLILNVLKLLKQVRNNIAHNQPIIDNRFLRDRGLKFLELEKSIKEISNKIESPVEEGLSFYFNEITDSIIVLYIHYIWLIEEDELSKRLLLFISKYFINNEMDLDYDILSKILGAKFKQKFDCILKVYT